MFQRTVRHAARTAPWCCREQAVLIRRAFHASRRRDVVKPFLLADIGEGTRECQIIQWFVQPGARVEQFDKLCEVQSDKTASDITSPFDGVIKKLYYEPDDMAIVGKPLVDIDIQSEISEQDEAKLGDAGGKVPKTEEPKQEEAQISQQATAEQPTSRPPRSATQTRSDTENRSLATPAVRHLVKQHNVDILDIEGTGKDGRILKEDVHRHVQGGQQSSNKSESAAAVAPVTGEDRSVSLTPVQNAMFKSMTRSLTIPHFLYSMTVDMTNLTTLRTRINARRAKEDKLTPLPFILKAISLAFAHHPLLNSSLDTSSPQKPQLTYRAAHNFGIAVDTPSGLMVPVVKNVQGHSVGSLASAIKSLSNTARDGKLKSADLQDCTFSVSNIGSIGGGVVAPVIVEPQVAIVGIGRGKIVPAFDSEGNLIRKEEAILSWSADHRVVDGAECARAAERVRAYLENVEDWVLEMR